MSAPCANCAAPVDAAYCGACGERRRSNDALSLRHLVAETFEAVTSFDLRLLRTVMVLVARPGEVTRAYMAGARSRFTPPIQLFLLINVVFFFAAPKLGLFDYRLSPKAADVVVAQAHGEPRPPGAVPVPAMPTLVDAVRRHGWSAAELRAQFDVAVEQRTHALVSLYIALAALLLLAAYAWRGRYAAEHVVFATHYVTFVFLYLPVVGLTIWAAAPWLDAHGHRIAARALAATFTPALALGLYGHLVVALRRVYGDRWPAAALRALIILVVFVLVGRTVFYTAVIEATARFL